MNNLVFGMKVINITQLPGGSYSHPNMAVDLAGSDSGIDYWFAQGYWKCIAGPWGSGTYFFMSCNSAGAPAGVHCADDKERIVTLALTHSARKFARPVVGQVYGTGTPIYEEGTVGQATANHIHLEIADGIRTGKSWDAKLGVYRMDGELDPIKVMYVLRSFSKVKDAHGADLKYCDTLAYTPPIPPPPVMEKGKLYFVADTTSCRIRQKLAFTNGRPIGAILATMPKGAVAEITHFSQRHEKDGFEWFQVKYTTVTGDTVNGFVQGDLGAYLIKKGG